jgi:2-methylisocitrate lyase-like PEP mutase family enzyme
MSHTVRAARPRPTLRRLLQGDGIIVAPGAYDMLSALLIEQAGFPCLYLTGNGQAASALGLPDLGMITLAEMAERLRRTTATVGIPVIVDADDGYGNLLMLQRAVREFEAAGASAIQLEDQASPKKCGHELGREVVPVEDMIARLRAAVDARADPHTLLIARTDARTTHGLVEAIRRGRIYAEHGADVVFVESPESEEEFAEIARSIDAPLLANMVETSRSPYLPWQRLQQLGFKIAIYPGSAFLAAARAVQDVLRAIHDHGSAAPLLERMMTLKQYHDVLHFQEYAALERGYRAPAADASTGERRR